ncbi:Protease Do-like 10, mitochondrial [Sesamum angolense]|uniref:Protease Do-like 10, mitochondrial n=1 Tax=Sesamum angolense TaxID=2727404 RepID=A0AAE1T0D8_9LAMI|nr:Protease Do-like 10, mitochondrial [Sesamum angolense]
MLGVRSAAAARAAVRRLRSSANHLCGSSSSSSWAIASHHSRFNNPIRHANAVSYFSTKNNVGYFRFSSVEFYSTCSASNSSTPPDAAASSCGSSVENCEGDAEAAPYAATRTAAMDDAHYAIELALDSVVKIFTVASSPSYFLPWQNKSQRESMGSGFIISGRRILTNAHVVADHTFVLVRKHGSPNKYKAEVQAVGHECDLAILVVGNEEFWEGTNCLELGDIPFLQEAVAVVGYPQGGDNISVTKGVVSRVEPTQYVHGAAQLLAIQIDAAINPGNSGGPAIMGDKVAGVAFQNLSNAENIGYIIPVPVIKHFIEGVEETGVYVGFCSMGLSCQPTENAQLREDFQMPPGLTGVLVHFNLSLSVCVSVWDVSIFFKCALFMFTVPFRNRERITFDHLVSMKRPNDTAQVKVFRDGKEHEFIITLRPLQPLVPVHQFDKLPSYFIFAGLVFIPLTQPYLHEYGEDWYNTSPRRLCERALREMPQKAGQQLVILSQVLMDDINTGYERLADLQVMKVNGREVDNLKHLRQLVENSSNSVRFDLDDEKVIVLNYNSAKMATSRILKRHRIPSAMSNDLVDEEGSSNIELACAK